MCAGELPDGKQRQAERKAAAAAEISVEEVLTARDAESDRGIPAAMRADLTAEEQSEILAYAVAKRKLRNEEALRSSSSTARIAGDGDGASVRIARSSAGQPSDAASFRTAISGEQTSR